MSADDTFHDLHRRHPERDEQQRGRWQQAREERRRLVEELRTVRTLRQEERLEQRRKGTEDPLQPIWLRLRELQGRGHNALSYEQIVDAAIALADAEGPKAITMRKIAQTLGVGTMSLYWYVPSKDDLIDLMLDEIYGEMVDDMQLSRGSAGPDGDWRADLAASARSRRAVMLRHPWLLTHIGAGPPRGPNALRAVEGALAALEPAGLDHATAMDTITAVDTFVTGFALREQLDDQENAAKGGFADISPEEVSAYIATLFASGQYPRLEAVIRAGIDPDDPAKRDARFEFGLSCLLDGIAARVRRRQTPPESANAGRRGRGPTFTGSGPGATTGPSGPTAPRDHPGRPPRGTDRR